MLCIDSCSIHAHAPIAIAGDNGSPIGMPARCRLMTPHGTPHGISMNHVWVAAFDIIHLRVQGSSRPHRTRCAHKLRYLARLIYHEVLARDLARNENIMHVRHNATAYTLDAACPGLSGGLSFT